MSLPMALSRTHDDCRSICQLPQVARSPSKLPTAGPCHMRRSTAMEHWGTHLAVPARATTNQ